MPSRNHHVNEDTNLDDLEKLTDLYEMILEKMAK
jgi:acetylornithine deacetylase/succinyl-diaminopimelate desuccinylase-like protein